MIAVASPYLLRFPEVTPLHASSGGWNFSTLGEEGADSPAASRSSSSSAANISIKKIEIKNGKLTVAQASSLKSEAAQPHFVHLRMFVLKFPQTLLTI
jgi:hypothetical protein